jgi:fructose-1,6-bisphosphatase/inositol monophosphatase family enzyme
MTPVSLKENLAFLVDIAREAGAIAMDAFGGALRVWHKSENDPVTDVDLAIDRFIRAKLLAARPGYGWLSEEDATEHRAAAAGRLFIVDPIDGTQSFAHGHPEFSVAIAVVEAGVPLAGVVYAPAKKDLIEGATGHGVRRNGAAVTMTERTKIAGAAVVNYTEQKSGAGMNSFRTSVSLPSIPSPIAWRWWRPAPTTPLSRPPRRPTGTWRRPTRSSAPRAAGSRPSRARCRATAHLRAARRAM